MSVLKSDPNGWVISHSQSAQFEVVEDEVNGLRLGDKPRCLISQVPWGGAPSASSIDVLST